MNNHLLTDSDRELLHHCNPVRRLVSPTMKPMDADFTLFPYKERARIERALHAAVNKAVAGRTCVLPPQIPEPLDEAAYFAPPSFEDKRVMTVYKRALHGLRTEPLADDAVISEQARQEVIQAFVHAVHQVLLGR